MMNDSVLLNNEKEEFLQLFFQLVFFFKGQVKCRVCARGLARKKGLRHDAGGLLAHTLVRPFALFSCLIILSKIYGHLCRARIIWTLGALNSFTLSRR